jgi:hypothetical protein
MKLAVGMITAQRPSPTVTDSITSVIRAFNLDRQIVVFAEPGSIDRVDEFHSKCLLVNRPYSVTPNAMPVSPSGILGNFGNWIQSARDLLALNSDADTFLMCEDDISVTPEIHRFVSECLWPSPHCGCISLYCPAMTHYTEKRGLVRTDVRYTDVLHTHHNLVGALCLLFPRRALEELVSNQHAIDEWGGSHQQRRMTDLQPWQRKAIDTWIGRTLIHMGWQIWNFNPGLVRHTGTTSSLGNNRHKSRLNSRWIGNTATFFVTQREVHVDVCPSTK